MIQRVHSIDSTKRVLLIGGGDRGTDRQKMAAYLANHNVEIGWHWPVLTPRAFPDCDAVIVLIQFCCHPLFHNVMADAKKAGVPVINFDTWSRSLPAMRRVGLIRSGHPVPSTIVAAAAMATWEPRIGTFDLGSLGSLGRPRFELPTAPKEVQVTETIDPEVQADPSPEELQPRPNKFGRESPLTPEEQIDEYLMEAHNKWASVSEEIRRHVLLTLAAYDRAPATTWEFRARWCPRDLAPNVCVDEVVQNLICPPDSTPRAFIAMLLVITSGKDNHVTRETFKRLRQDYHSKGVDYKMIARMIERAPSLFGSLDIGIRTTTTQEKTSMAPSAPIHKTISDNPALTKLQALLPALLATGEAVTVLQSAPSVFILTYANDVSITVRAPAE